MKRCLPLLLVVIMIVGCGDKKAPVDTQPASNPAPVFGRQVPLEQYTRTKISVKDKVIDVYVADEDGERAEGLKFVKHGELAEDEGMIFVFPTSAPLSFWMENTLIPLDIAYLDESGKILNIRQMQPLDTSPQPSAGAARYAVEMNEGWFENSKIKVGDKFDLASLN